MVISGANRHDSPLLGPTLDQLDDLGPLPKDITVHLDAGYDSAKTRDLLAERGLRGEIAHRVNLKFAPDLRFRVDERFDEAERIEKLLRTPAVQRDLAPDSDDK